MKPHKTHERNHPALQHMGAHKSVKFGIVFVDGSAAVASTRFEAPDDDHVG
jgi:hypothetical protein